MTKQERKEHARRERSERFNRELERRLSQLPAERIDRFTINQSGKLLTVYSEKHGLLAAVRMSTNLDHAELEEVALRRAARRFAYLRSLGGSVR